MTYCEPSLSVVELSPCLLQWAVCSAYMAEWDVFCLNLTKGSFLVGVVLGVVALLACM